MRGVRMIARALELPPAERALAARAWLLAPCIEAGLVAMGLRATLKWIERLPRRAAQPTDAVRPKRAEVLVERAFQLHPLLAGK